MFVTVYKPTRIHCDCIQNVLPMAFSEVQADGGSPFETYKATETVALDDFEILVRPSGVVYQSVSKPLKRETLCKTCMR